MCFPGRTIRDCRPYAPRSGVGRIAVFLPAAEDDEYLCCPRPPWHFPFSAKSRAKRGSFSIHFLLLSYFLPIFPAAASVRRRRRRHSHPIPDPEANFMTCRGRPRSLTFSRGAAKEEEEDDEDSPLSFENFAPSDSWSDDHMLGQKPAQ